ncbi:MAG: ATP-binding protein [Alphaproteobacteria bacterium]|nr:ATP-binding protein [Alphaproteobacteria bacterium]
MYYERTIESLVKRYLELFPALIVTGPRQCGKSTLLRQLLPQYQHVTFDDPVVLGMLQEDPISFLDRYKNPTVFDEAQKAPEIFSLLKLAIDSKRFEKGRYVLTGSSQFQLMKGVKESLAGRAGILTLYPFHKKEVPQVKRAEMEWKGSYPEVVVNEYQGWQEWYRSYINTFVEKDIRDMSDIGDLRDFRRFVRLLASRVGQVLNMSDLSRDMGLSVPTIKRWLSFLEAAYIIFLLPPYYKNFGKRLIKAPKLYFWDVGIVSSLVGIQTQDHYENGPMAGFLFENYVISELMKDRAFKGIASEFFYFRTHHGVEIDLVEEQGNHTVAYEIKFSKTYTSRMTQNLSQLEGMDQKYLIYRGVPLDLSPNLSAVYYSDI